MAPTIRRALPGLAAFCLLLLSGCYGVSHNPSYFPWNFKPFGDIPDTIDGLVFRGEATGDTGVPEPASLALLGAGLTALALISRRK